MCAVADRHDGHEGPGRNFLGDDHDLAPLPDGDRGGFVGTLGQARQYIRKREPTPTFRRDPELSRLTAWRCCMDPPSGVRNRRGVGGCALT